MIARIFPNELTRANAYTPSLSSGERAGVRGRVRLLLTLALIAFLHPQAHACAVCFGKSDSAMAKGMNMGMFVLLICITGVLATLSCFFVFLAVRSSKHPPGDATTASLNSPDNPAHS